MALRAHHLQQNPESVYSSWQIDLLTDPLQECPQALGFLASFREDRIDLIEQQGRRLGLDDAVHDRFARRDHH